MCFAMGQGNVFYPLMPFGLHWTTSIIISVAGDCVRRLLPYVTGRRLSATETASSEPLPDAEQNNQGILSVINSAGRMLSAGTRSYPDAYPVIIHCRINAGRR